MLTGEFGILRDRGIAGGTVAGNAGHDTARCITIGIERGTLGWICSFSIPIITLCAFIVLSIFLSLFDLIFKWMAFIKICIPFPKKGD